MPGPGSSALLARDDDFSAGHWGAAGASVEEKAAWGGKNVLLTRDGAVAPASASRPFTFSNLKAGRVVGMHYAWGVDGRVYFVQQRVAHLAGLTLPGASGDWASTPDHADWSGWGAIQIRARITATDYTAAAGQTIVGHWNETGNQRGWVFGITTDGRLRFRLSDNGTTIPVDVQTAVLGLTNGETYWVGASYEASSGSWVLAVYDDGSGIGTPPGLGFSGWTLQDAGLTATDVPHTSSAALGVGAINAGAGERFTGTIHAVHVELDGTGTGAYPNFTDMASPLPEAGDTSSTDSAGRVWTIHGAAAIAGDGDGGKYQLRRFDPSDPTAIIAISDVGSPIDTVTREPDWADFSGKVYLTIYSEKTWEIDPVAPSMTALTDSPGDAPGGRALTTYGERLFIAGIDDGRLGTIGNRVCYSEAADIDHFPDDNFFDAGADTSEIAGLYVLADTLVIVFADQQVWTFRGVPGGASNLRRQFGFHAGSGGTEGFQPSHGAIDPSQVRLWMKDHPVRGLARFSGSQFARQPGFGVTTRTRSAVSTNTGAVLAMGGPDEVFVDEVPMPRTEGDTAYGDALVLVRINGVFSLVERAVVAGGA